MNENLLNQNGIVFEHHVNLNERGSYYADVRKASNGRTVFTIKAGNELEEGESSIFEDGYMKHTEDMDGLREHLIELGIMKQRDRLINCH